MAEDILNCPRCLARLRRSPDLEPGMAVACPRCQARFPVPTTTSARGGDARLEPRSLVFDPRRSPDPGRRQLLREADDDEDSSERVPLSGRGLNLHLRLVCALHGLLILGALEAAFYEVRTILISGPLISFLGLYVAALSLRRSFWLGVAAGLSGVGFSLFIVLLINVLGWGPPQAHVPVCLMGAIYAAVSIQGHSVIEARGD